MLQNPLPTYLGGVVPSWGAKGPELVELVLKGAKKLRLMAADKQERALRRFDGEEVWNGEQFVVDTAHVHGHLPLMRRPQFEVCGEAIAVLVQDTLGYSVEKKLRLVQIGA